MKSGSVPPGRRSAPRGRSRPRRPVAHDAGREADLEITSIAAGGDGVGRWEGLVVFTPRTAPGDLARVRAVPARSGRLARGRLVRLIRPSPLRVDPACPHFTHDRCGGCQLQHLGYPAQLEAKAGIIHDALTRIARRSLDRVAVRPSASIWRYRRKLTLALRRGRGGDWVGGLHRFDAPDEVFELEDCPITDPSVVAAWRAVRAAAGLLPAGPSLRIAIRTVEGGMACVVEGGLRWPDATRFAAAVPALGEIWWAPEVGSRRRIVGPGGGPAARPVAGSLPATGASFVQVNPGVGEALHAEVIARALSYRPARVADAYAGTGTTALALAGRGIRVTAIEADPQAAGHCAALLPPGSRVLAARVEDVSAELVQADVVILNPPRQGLAAAVTSHLATVPKTGVGPRAIIYVSCDPATLARDLTRLSDWRIAGLQAFDMFPQTAHVETICELVPGVTRDP